MSIAELIPHVGSEDKSVMFDCPGCGMSHSVRVLGEGHPRWEWNGSLESPTFKPSILVTWPKTANDEVVGQNVCHSYVTDGQIQFLGDCTHPYAGQTLPLREM